MSRDKIELNLEQHWQILLNNFVEAPGGSLRHVTRRQLSLTFSAYLTDYLSSPIFVSFILNFSNVLTV